MAGSGIIVCGEPANMEWNSLPVAARYMDMSSVSLEEECTLSASRG